MTRNKSKVDKNKGEEEKKSSNKEKKSEGCDKTQVRQWEAARRHRFNTILEKLRLALPDCGPRAKAEIIQTAIDYIQDCKALKESVLAGNESQELKKEVKRLMKQVTALKQRNALLVKLLQETGLRFEADDGNVEIIYTIPGKVSHMVLIINPVFYFSQFSESYC
nr:uncharacterized protein LOC128695931 isoform X2 [Cherax quadricarinatus]